MMVLWKARGGLNPLEGFLSVDHSPGMVPWWFPPSQPKGLNPLEGFLSVGHSPCMVPWWFPPQPKGLNPLEGFSVLIIFPVMFVYDGVPEVTPHYQWGNGKPTRPRRRKVLFVLEVSQCLVLGVSRCWKWVDFWCWKWMVNLWTGLGPRSTT